MSNLQQQTAEENRLRAIRTVALESIDRFEFLDYLKRLLIQGEQYYFIQGYKLSWKDVRDLFNKI